MFALNVATQKVCLCLGQSIVSLCWERPSLVVSTVTFHFLCVFCEAPTHFMPGAYLMPGTDCTHHAVYVNLFILHNVTLWERKAL